MRSYAHISLIVLMLFQLSYKSVCVLDWKINQDLITAKYCVNKDRPMLHCNGQCYLAKQLRKLDQEEQRERSRHAIPAAKLKQVESPLIAVAFDYFYTSAQLPYPAGNQPAVSNPADCRPAILRTCFHPPETWIATVA